MLGAKTCPMASSLVKNEHVLNFHEGVERLPEWLEGTYTLSLMMGAGDLCQEGVLNVEKFSNFDIFFCNAWDQLNSFKNNVDYLCQNYHHRKAICVIDVNNKEEMAQFVKLFTHRFYCIDGFGQHTPHMNITDLEKVMYLGGKATNIYELSENVINFSEMMKWLQDEYYPYIGLVDANVCGENGFGRDLTEQEKSQIIPLMLLRIRRLLANSMTVRLSPAVEELLDSYSLSDLQKILRGLLYEANMPLNMVGEIKLNMRSWRPYSYIELVIQRVEVDYKMNEIAECGDSELKERLTMLTDAIKSDLQTGFNLGARMKYKRLLKLVSASLESRRTSL